MDLFQYSGILCLCLLELKTCDVGSQHISLIYPGFKASQQEWINSDGRFLLSNNLVFGLGFHHGFDEKQFALAVTHISSGTGVWTANRGSIVAGSDKFLLEKNGNVYLQKGNGVAWSSNSTGQKVTSMELQDSGNLVVRFSYSTDTLLTGQGFWEGMRLESHPNKYNSKVHLEFKSGDLILYARYQTPQTHWSLANEGQKNNNNVSGEVHSTSLVANARNFYDQNKYVVQRRERLLTLSWLCNYENIFLANGR